MLTHRLEYETSGRLARARTAPDLLVQILQKLENTHVTSRAIDTTDNGRNETEKQTVAT